MARESTGLASETTRDGRDLQATAEPSPLSHLPLRLGPRSPWGCPGCIGGCGAPSQGNSCGLAPGASSTRMGTPCSPLRCCCSFAGPVGRPHPRPRCLTWWGTPACPLSCRNPTWGAGGGAPWEDSGGTTAIAAPPAVRQAPHWTRSTKQSANTLSNPPAGRGWGWDVKAAFILQECAQRALANRNRMQAASASRKHHFKCSSSHIDKVKHIKFISTIYFI